MCRLLVGLHTDAPDRDVEFVGDQVALLLQVSPMTGRNLVGLALSAAALPGLLEGVEADLLTERHVRAVLDELQKVPLSEVQQAAVVAVVLSRPGGQTPGELGRLVRRTVLLIDVHAAEHRYRRGSASGASTSAPVRTGRRAWWRSARWRRSLPCARAWRQA